MQQQQHARLARLLMISFDCYSVLRLIKTLIPRVAIAQSVGYRLSIV